MRRRADAHLRRLPRPVPPPGEQELRPVLPTPPLMLIGDVAYILERVPIDDIMARRERLGLRLSHVAWCGALGWVSIEIPKERS